MITIKSIYNSSLFRKSFVYVFCDGINRAIPFLLLPLITRYLTPADYGVVTNFNVYIQILAVFCYSCTIAAVPVMYYKLDAKERCKYISSIILLNTLAQILCSIIALIANGLVFESMNISLPFQILAIVSVWFSGITFLNMVLWRCEERPLSFGIFQISSSALNALSTVLFVVIMLLGWQGRIYSMMLSTILFGVISLFIMIKKKYFIPSFDKKYIYQTICFAIPIMPHALSFWFRGGTDKILLTNMVGMSENGLYSVALTWGSIVAMFLTAFNNAYAPYLYKHLAMFDKDKEGTINGQKRIVKLIWGMIGLTLVFVALMYVVSHFLILLIYTPNYYGSLNYLPLVMAAQFFQGVYFMFVCFAHYTFKTKGLGAITFSLSVAQIGVTYLLISWVGAIGAAISSCIITMLIGISVMLYAMKVYQLPWFKFKIRK